MPTDARALVEELPDTPRWVETRALLLSGTAIVRGAAGGDGAVVLDPALPAGFLVGRADPALVRGVVAGAAEDFELVVQSDVIGDACAALPGWTLATATVFTPTSPWDASRAGATPADVVICAPPNEHWIARVPEADEVRFYAALAQAVALRLVDGAVVAVCAAGDVTETLWDVGIDTVEEHRRAGHGTAAFRALAAHMAAAGQQPVWCAEDANMASMAMAVRLGFEPVDRLGILKRGDAWAV
ncbi:MAG TPA: GNAT family N-acetyltransferase [Solirubrobacteraceae bacterium]|nr:GNAT family N-acetyltransferase [Solirubrobacteraceae bacterium]